ncbi:hypothetical protein [Clostridium sp. C2-6-12]|uniref:hypothetical protein n=1 Tax=Clostridium sp. C2-6-12 TaxID=2698832 RepID=UPI0013718D32|nr:hypothetical protein [Clostridium sp. C2-6-12]
MDLYSTIVNEISNFAETHTPISDIAHKYNFEMVPIPKDPNFVDGNTWTCFHAIKQDGEYSLSITIETREKYRSYGNDEEPYTNTITITKDNTVIDTKSYIYFE